MRVSVVVTVVVAVLVVDGEAVALAVIVADGELVAVAVRVEVVV